MNLIDKHIEAIRDLCKKHHVERLFVFGSVLTNHFNKSSDVDFLVHFEGVELNLYADNYFDLKGALELLLQREVDLLEAQALKNPFLKKSIDASKQLVYEQRDKNLVI